VRFAGAARKENVGMSNDKAGEKPARRKFLYLFTLRWGDDVLKAPRTDGIVR
jgi:hypothetical protein